MPRPCIDLLGGDKKQVNPKLTVKCSPRSAQLTERGCRMCRDAAEEALSSLKQHGVGGISVIGQDVMDCLAACSVCGRWEHKEKGYFAKALKADLKAMGEKLDHMEENWYTFDPEMSRRKKRKHWKKFSETEHRQQYLKDYRERKRREKNEKKTED
jgi:hypothetical protein